MLTDAIVALWRNHLGPGNGFFLTPCPVSGNNRVFLVRADGRTAIAKCYYRSLADNRDRLEAEWRLLRFAAEAGVSCVPRALACDSDAGLALYEQLPGRRPAPHEIGPAQITAAAGFFRSLNAARHRAADLELPKASEAGFSAMTHMSLLERRLAKLAAIVSTDAIDRQAAGLAADMSMAWLGLRHRLTEALNGFGIDPANDLPPWQRCVSPSDFGFHNALLDEHGVLRFIDFEYAGWDDPAKALCDFFLQPAVPVDPAHWNAFTAAALAEWPDREKMIARARILQPLFALRWCCIMLNVFVADLARPGLFADPATDPTKRKRDRLAQATARFQTIRKE